MFARGAWLALIAVFLSACSTIKIAYNQADTIAAWLADDYFELDGAQRQMLRAHFRRIHAWHRATQLDEYAALLVSARRRLDAGVRADDVIWAIDSIKAKYRALVLHSYADAVEVLSTLTDAQLAAARRQFEKNNREYAADHGVGATSDEQRRLRAQRYLRRIEHWTGPLDPRQEARIAEMSRALPLLTELRLQDRLRRQEQFLALLELRNNARLFAPKLRDWLADWDRNRAPEYQAALEPFAAASTKMTVEVFALLTPEQRRHVDDRLQRYVSAFRELAREAPQIALETER
jgi:hypothetical protein